MRGDLKCEQLTCFAYCRLDRSKCCNCVKLANRKSCSWFSPNVILSPFPKTERALKQRFNILIIRFEQILLLVKMWISKRHFVDWRHRRVQSRHNWLWRNTSLAKIRFSVGTGASLVVLWWRFNELYLKIKYLWRHISNNYNV